MSLAFLQTVYMLVITDIAKIPLKSPRWLNATQEQIYPKSYKLVENGMHHSHLHDGLSYSTCPYCEYMFE
jgi:hypothetical protein